MLQMHDHWHSGTVHPKQRWPEVQQQLEDNQCSNTGTWKTMFLYTQICRRNILIIVKTIELKQAEPELILHLMVQTNKCTFKTNSPLKLILHVEKLNFIRDQKPSQPALQNNHDSSSKEMFS